MSVGAAGGCDDGVVGVLATVVAVVDPILRFAVDGVGVSVPALLPSEFPLALLLFVYDGASDVYEIDGTGGTGERMCVADVDIDDTELSDALDSGWDITVSSRPPFSFSFPRSS